MNTVAEINKEIIVVVEQQESSNSYLFLLSAPLVLLVATFVSVFDSWLYTFGAGGGGGGRVGGGAVGGGEGEQNNPSPRNPHPSDCLAIKRTLTATQTMALML